jgi:hypothetical protein
MTRLLIAVAIGAALMAVALVYYASTHGQREYPANWYEDDDGIQGADPFTEAYRRGKDQLF